MGFRPRSACSDAGASQLFLLKKHLKSLGSFILGDTDTAHSRVVVRPTQVRAEQEAGTVRLSCAAPTPLLPRAARLQKQTWSSLGALRELDLRVLHSCVPADLLTHLRSLRRIRLALQLTERRPGPGWHEDQRRQPEYIAVPPFVVSDVDVAGLSSSLVELRIDGRVEGGFDVFAGFTGAGLARLTGLASLALVHCALPAGAFHALPASVHSLDVSSVTGLTAASFDAMPHPASLRTLRLDGGTTGIDAAAFARLSGLEELHVGPHDSLCCNSLLFALARHGSLRVLTSSPPPAKLPPRDARAPAPPRRPLSSAGWSALLSACPLERLDLSADNAAGLLRAMGPEERLHGRADSSDDERDGEAAAGGAAAAAAAAAEAPVDAVAALRAPPRARLSFLAIHAPAKAVGHAAYRFGASNTLQSLASAPFSGLTSLTLARATLPRYPSLFEPLASTLVALDVRGCSGFCDTAFAPLVALRSLDISACKDLGVHVLRSLPAGLTTLRLDSAPPAFSVDDKLLAKLSTACPQLSRLSLRGSCEHELFEREERNRWGRPEKALAVKPQPATTAEGWAALLRAPRGLYQLDLGYAMVARASLALLRLHVADLRCGKRSGADPEPAAEAPAPESDDEIVHAPAAPAAADDASSDASD